MGGDSEGYTSAAKASILVDMKIAPGSVSEWWAQQPPTRRLAIWTAVSYAVIWVADKTVTLAFEAWLASRGADQALIAAESWLLPPLQEAVTFLSSALNDKLVIGVALGAFLVAVLPPIFSFLLRIPDYMRRALHAARFGSVATQNIKIAREWVSLGNEIQQFLTEERAFDYVDIDTRLNESFDEIVRRLNSTAHSLKGKYRQRFSGRVEAARQEIAKRDVPSRDALVMPGDDVNPLCMQDAAEKIAAAGHRLLAKYGARPD